MIEFRRTMDDRSLDVYYGEKMIGSLNWHTGTFEFVSYMQPLKLSTGDLQKIIDKEEEIRASWKK